MATPKSRITVIMLLTGGALLAGVAAAGAGAEPRQREGLLAAPSEPGPHVGRIKALGDNQWLDLGSPAPDPKWGKARGRSWSSNMPAAPDLRGAFVFAEGVHAFVKPDGYYMNDLWFYDINAHRWQCLYPGIEVKTIARRIRDKELTLDDRGLLVDKDGQPLPPLLIHAYGYLGYDPDLRQFVTFGSQFGNYFTTSEGGVFEEAYKLFEQQRKGKTFPELSPFFYDAAAGRWDCFPVTNAPGGRPYGANVLVYVAGKRQFFYGGSDGVWFLDRDKRTWTSAEPTGEPPTGIDHCAAYDPKRDRIYYHYHDEKAGEKTGGADTFLFYDVKADAWVRPRPTGAGPAFSSAYESVFNYDSANDALVVIRLYDTKDQPGLRRGVYVYDPQANAWADPLPLPPEVVKAVRNGNYGFYDPGLNAYFCHFAGDSTDDGTMWAYCYKNPAGKQ
jgi:hypothetical protein